MLGESMTARNNSSWWMSIYLLQGGMAAQLPVHATWSARGGFSKSNRSNAVMTIPQILSFKDKLRLCGARHRGNSTKKRMVLWHGVWPRLVEKPEHESG